MRCPVLHESGQQTESLLCDPCVSCLSQRVEVVLVLGFLQAAGGLHTATLSLQELMRTFPFVKQRYWSPWGACCWGVYPQCFVNTWKDEVIVCSSS